MSQISLRIDSLILRAKHLQLHLKQTASESVRIFLPSSSTKLRCQLLLLLPRTLVHLPLQLVPVLLAKLDPTWLVAAELIRVGVECLALRECKTLLGGEQRLPWIHQWLCAPCGHIVDILRVLCRQWLEFPIAGGSMRVILRGLAGVRPWPEDVSVV